MQGIRKLERCDDFTDDPVWIVRVATELSQLETGGPDSGREHDIGHVILTTSTR